VTDYERCNLGQVKANALVVRGGANYDDSKTKAIINLFLYAQQYYGRKDEDDFKYAYPLLVFNLRIFLMKFDKISTSFLFHSFAMFHSPPPYSDLIFQDSAQQLRVIPQEQRNYRAYLGQKFLKARALVDCRASANNIHGNFSVLLALLALSNVLYSIST
jgi:melanoma-associated antigen p97